MPLHYPRFNKADYETMPEWKLDCLFADYGLPVTDDVKQKREFAMGAFLWPSQSISQLYNVTLIMDRDRGVMGTVNCDSWQLSACRWRIGGAMEIMGSG
ncbi:hypothetical protein RHSIM_Rhsim07G0084800 [Rhododendron simsii]|uniref:DUF7722 domain-containing protein n=1 Tax=Rhododendron simsii TaxID=118357 RepID=A0A834LGS7_RHOSS|nr:hypothetical protein RHSIM_Rhsim07G0084800 [Rhododendron simsii]